MWDKGLILNLINCECECDKSCDVGKYSDYKNCRCRKRLLDKLVERCSENIDGNKMIYNGTLNAVPLNDYWKMCNFCTVYIILSAIFFKVSISNSSVFIYFCWYLKRRYTETTIYWTQFHWKDKWEMLKK